MKKNIIIIISFFITAFCYSQQCLSDEYLKKVKTPQLDKKITNVISSFKNNHSNTTNKGLAIQNIVSDEIIVIPVVFNVIHNGEPIGTGRNISLSKINEQITIMNQAYGGEYGGVDTKIRFCLAKQNTVGQVSTGVNRFLGNSSYDVLYGNEINLIVDKEIKTNISSGFPNSLFLNIWTADLKGNGQDGVNGYSSFPYVLGVEDVDNTLDGIVLDYIKVGVNVTANPNDINNSNGSTAIHEAGHWLGLFHIFQDNDKLPCNEVHCDTEGDMICDTESVPAWGLTNIVTSGNCLGYDCNGHTTDVVQNFMDYQTAARLYCRTKFTAGQKERMRDIVSFYRSSIYNQGIFFDLTACKSYSYGGGGGGGCSEDLTLPVQIIRATIMPQDSSNYETPSIVFGQRLEVNDQWLVTVNERKGTTKPISDYIIIYKREGCKYILYQSFEININNWLEGDFGLILNGNEIIISSSSIDLTYILRLNESNNSWGIAQQINNDSTSEVGSSTYILGRFLFILEYNKNANNIFRVYYKNDTGNYVFHQTISVSGVNLPSRGNYLQSGNFKKSIINFNSSTFTGSYDPLEILVANNSSLGFLMFELNSNNMWTLTVTVMPPGMSSSEKIFDIELSKDFIYVLTYSNPDGYLNDTKYLYTYKFNNSKDNIFSFQSVYSKQVLISNTEAYNDTKLQVFNDQFLFIDSTKFGPMTLFYNQNFGSTNLPNWIKKNEKRITCSIPNHDEDDFEVYGNLLFYGYGGDIEIYNISDILTREGNDKTFIDNSDFYNKKVNFVPENYSTSAQKITIGESTVVQFNYVKKEFIANTSIILKPGTTLSRGSEVTLKIKDIYNLCNSIVTSKEKKNKFEFGDDEYLNEIEDEKFLNSVYKGVLYPNPNSGVFTLYIGNDKGKLSYDIYDNVGKSMYSGSTEKSTLDINLPNLPIGVYIVKLKGDNYKEIIKFIKQ